jgi:hypothetical protein
MGDITEIPLDIPEVAEDIPDIQEDIPDTLPNIALQITEPEKPKPKAKPKGRPKGAANKGPSKPRVKKVQVSEVEVEESAYEPSSPRRNLKIPTDPTSSEVAAAMLKMLQDQSFSRQNRKQRLYNSWFQ